MGIELAIRVLMVPAMDVMTLGRMAVVVDAGGAVIGMWQPGEHRGFAYVGAFNSCHFGAAGYYAAMAAAEDMIGLAMANDTPSVTAPGARSAAGSEISSCI